PAVYTGLPGLTTYTFTPDAGECATSTTLNITVLDQTIPTFDLISDVCLNAPEPILNTTSNNGVQGTWSPAVSTSLVGTETYTFTPDAGECATSTTLNITVLDQIVPTFDLISDVCLNAPEPI